MDNDHGRTRDGRVYVPVGNPFPDLNGSTRKGDNLYTNSIVVLDAATGKLIWYVQQSAHDIHDWDTAAAPMLYELDGRRMMAVGSKDSHLYLYDRDSHSLVARRDLGRRLNDTLPLTAAFLRVCPGYLGGVEWNGPAYDPVHRLVFVNSVDWCTRLRSTANPSWADVVPDPVSEASGWLRAFDAATGAERWAYHADGPMLAGVTPTATGLVFTGSTSGDFLAFDAVTGGQLFSFYTGGALAGGVSTYMVDDRQYVAVLSGNTSKSTWKTTGAGTLIVFGLP